MIRALFYCPGYSPAFWLRCTLLIAGLQLAAGCGSHGHPTPNPGTTGGTGGTGGGTGGGSTGGTTGPAQGNVVLTPRPNTAPPFVSNLFGDHMVLQHTGANLFGWTSVGTQVTVTIPELNLSKTATADASGFWLAQMGALQVGGPYTVQISGPQQVSFTDVMAGEVWLSTGQSNSVVALGDIVNDTYAAYDPSWQTLATTEIANANNTQVRLFFQQWAQTNTLSYEAAGGAWQAVSSDAVQSFAAVPYLFARNLQQNLQMPVGVIECSLGGTSIREWVSARGLQSVGTLPEYDGTTASDLFNGMIAPYQGYSLAGVTWYQGEADATSPDTMLYGKMLTALLADWRATIGAPNLPFLVVQIANYGPTQSQAYENDGYDAMDVREFQRAVAAADAHAALVVTIDVGDANTIHPPNKWDVASRLTGAAMTTVYQNATAESSGPVYTGMSISGSTVTLNFSHTTGGLEVGLKSGVAPAHVDAAGVMGSFAVEDASGAWSFATAAISGNTVQVTAPTGVTPVAVCYGWAANPSCNLYNGAGLPASPFCTAH